MLFPAAGAGHKATEEESLMPETFDLKSLVIFTGAASDVSG